MKLLLLSALLLLTSCIFFVDATREEKRLEKSKNPLHLKGLFKASYDKDGNLVDKPSVYLPTYEGGLLSLKLSKVLGPEAGACQSCHDCCCGWKDPSKTDCDSCFYPYDCWNDWQWDCKPKPPPPPPPPSPSNASCCGCQSSSSSNATGGSSTSSGGGATLGNVTTSHAESGLGQLSSNATISGSISVVVNNYNIPFNGDITSCTSGCVNNDNVCLIECDNVSISCVAGCTGTPTEIQVCVNLCLDGLKSCGHNCTLSSERCMENCSFFPPTPPSPAPASSSLMKAHMDNLKDKVDRRTRYFKDKHNL